MAVPLGDEQDRARALGLIEQLPAAQGHGVVEWLGRLCQALSEQVGAVAATITLGAPGETSVVVAANDLASRRFGEAEFSAGEGPSHDAWSLRRPVLVPELGGAHDGDWPGYAQTAAEAGIRAVFAFPLQVGAIRAGVLTVFHNQPRRLDEADLNACLIMADLATKRLTDNSGTDPADQLDPDLEAAISYRSEIYQAQGMVAVELRISLVDALARMRAHAYLTGGSLIEVAVDIVYGKLRLAGHGDDANNGTHYPNNELD